ncbi:MAG: HAMP domain-containing sensor histidine kinase [Elainellaceae cyanobacterium]
MGLSTGLILLFWQRSHSNRKMKKLLKDLRPDVEKTPFSIASQLSLSIAYQQKIRQSLEAQLVTLKHIINCAPIGFLQVDDENQMIVCNAVAQRLLCMSPPLTPEEEPRLLLEWVRSYELDNLIEKTRTSQSPCQSDWIFYPYNPDPSRLSRQRSYALRGHGLPMPDHQVCIFIENRQEAVQLMQQRDRWASDVAHELKTPLTSIRLIAETLQARIDNSLQGWAERLINQTTRLNTLVQDLLDLSQLEQATFQLTIDEVDMVSLVHTAWSNLEPLVRKKNLKLNYIGPESVPVQIDEARFYRVLVNLLDNSIKFSPPWGTILVQIHTEAEAIASLQDTSQSSFADSNDLSLPNNIEDSPNNLDPNGSETPQEQSSSQELVYLDVIDTGPGFNEQDLPHVFERFYRSDFSRARLYPTDSAPISTTSSLPSSASNVSDDSSSSSGSDASESTPSASRQGNSQGSGLGLSIVYQIVEAHQGSVVARNHPETNGAWMQIRLPRYSTQ